MRDSRWLSGAPLARRGGPAPPTTKSTHALDGTAFDRINHRPTGINRRGVPVTDTVVAQATDTAPEPHKPAMPEAEAMPPQAAPPQNEGAPSNEDQDEPGEEDYEYPRGSSRAVIADSDRRRTAAGTRSSLVLRPGSVEEVLRAIDDMGYRHPTPIQEQAIPYVLMGRDVLGTAQTGTGKTAGFTLPMLDILSGSRARARMPRSLILEPTRELALQVAENFVQYGKYLKLTHALIIGGESMSDQKDVLNRGVDVLIATPGRLLDMFDRGTILLTDTKLLVIDEADRMLDMGFIPDVERIVSMLPTSAADLVLLRDHGPGNPPPGRRLPDKTPRKSRSPARPRSPRRSPRAWHWSPSTISGRRCAG